MIVHPHAGSGILDPDTAYQADRALDQIASQHPEAVRFFLRHKAGGDHDIVTLPDLCGHIGDVFRTMLPVAVKLHGRIIPMVRGIAHPGLKSSGKSEINGKIDDGIAFRMADLGRSVRGAVIDNDIIKLRMVRD